jgi:hypothetical protein
MPVNQAMWDISPDNPIELRPVGIDTEDQLEEALMRNVHILNDGWMVIGRQVQTSFNKYIDLLAVDGNGSIIIIELKRGKTPRDVVAQGIDYASWVKELSVEKIVEIYSDFDAKYLNRNQGFDQAYRERFGFRPAGEKINDSHQIIVVAADFDSSTERIVEYLSEFEVPVNVVMFKVYEVEGRKLISRAWLIDPRETEESATTQGGNPFNGEYYVSFGDDENRSWEDAMKYGFISGGGGVWYSRTLNILEPDHRIWVNIPGNGYVGVGKVIEGAKTAKEAALKDGKTIFELSHSGTYHEELADDEDRAEYLVRVEWIKTVPKNDAVREVGFFGNQNTACAPRTDAWELTVSRLKEIWNIA